MSIWKLNGIMFAEKERDDDNGVSWLEYTSQTGDCAITCYKGASIVDLGATIVKEPRTMTVWEWRKFPGVKFESALNLCLMWWDEFGYLRAGKNSAFDAKADLLESIGTEVLE